MDSPNLVALTDEKVDAAADILARAFVNDPALLFTLPDSSERARLSPELARMGARFAVRCGLPLITAGAARGVALWFPPDAKPPTQADLIETGIGMAPDLLGDEAWSRLKSLLDLTDRLHQTLAPDPHWYLTVLGVDPMWQRQGIGESLMRPVFDAADREGIRCYLEAPTVENARYYQRRGFRVAGEADVPGSNVHLWFMLREPQRT